MNKNTDVVIIGAGAVGSTIARELSKYQLQVVLVEKNEDVGGYASKCNSGTLCDGHDAPPGSLEAKTIIESTHLYEQICSDLDVKMKRTGMIYVAQNAAELKQLDEIKARAVANGLTQEKPLTKEQVLEMEPSVNPEITGGMLVPGEAVVDVMELMFANVENAMDNGVEVMVGTKVLRINLDDEKHCVKSVTTDKGDISCSFVINAAAIYADEIAETVGICDYRNYPRTGEFYVLDKNLPYAPSHIIAPLPTQVTRGKLVTPTINGNTLIGPSAVNGWDKEDTKTDKPTLDSILEDCRKMIPAINPADSVTQFTGVRPAIDPKDDWRVRANDKCKGYIEAVGISQGISGSPGVARYVAEILADEGLKMTPKDSWNPKRRAIRKFAQMTEAERDQVISENPLYGNVICRCETVTEAEIIEAIHKGPGARSVDAIKRRLRAGMGRCQGGFCGPRVIEILARELNVPAEAICKNEKGSEMVVCENRE